MENKGVIFDIQRFCLNDGPGVRTVIFLKGCPLNCIWCHNPESMSKQKQLQYIPHKCIGCGACVSTCASGVHTFVDGVHKVDFSLCHNSNKCTQVCCYGALSMVGKEMSLSEVMTQIEVDEPYFGEKGGVTLSGGEAMFQFEFVLELSKSIKEKNYSLCMETCGYASTEKFMEIAKYIDIFLYDYKVDDPNEHKRLTGVTNALILKNLKRLNDLGKRIILRCPIIPTINDTPDHFHSIAMLSKKFEMIESVELLPYHSLGEAKKEHLGKKEASIAIPPVCEETKKMWLAQLKKQGCNAVFG